MEQSNGEIFQRAGRLSPAVIVPKFGPRIIKVPPAADIRKPLCASYRRPHFWGALFATGTIWLPYRDGTADKFSASLSADDFVLISNGKGRFDDVFVTEKLKTLYHQNTSYTVDEHNYPEMNFIRVMHNICANISCKYIHVSWTRINMRLKQARLLPLMRFNYKHVLRKFAVSILCAYITCIIDVNFILNPFKGA